MTERTVRNAKTGEEEIEQTACLDALIAFKITPGVHSVRLEYKPASVFYGELISLLAVAILFLMAVLDYGILRPLKRKKRGEKVAFSTEKLEDFASESTGSVISIDSISMEKTVNRSPKTNKAVIEKKEELKKKSRPSGKKGKNRR